VTNDRDPLLVYTGIYGGYDVPKPIPDGLSDRYVWRLYCDTDNEAILPGWTRIVESRVGSPRMQAKFRKCHPPEDAKISLWIDGTVQLHSGKLIEMAVEALGGADWAMFQHPERNNILEEAEFSVPWFKYASQPLREQVAHYLRQGPVDGLWAGGLIARRHTPTVLAASTAWFEECVRWSDQDQLSLPFILAKYGIKVAPLVGWRKDFTLIEHTRPRE
jgi:hypothetical protein